MEPLLLSRAYGSGNERALICPHADLTAYDLFFLRALPLIVHGRESLL